MAWTPTPPTPGLLLRPAAHGDGPDLLRLYREAFAAYGARRPPPEDLRNVVVAELHGEVVGLGRSEPVGEATARLMTRLRRDRRHRLVPVEQLPRVLEGDHLLSALAVDARVRRQGIGRQLAEARLEAAAVSGAYHVFVHCVEGAGTDALYASLGFTALARVPDWYAGGQGMTWMAAPVGAPPAGSGRKV